MSQEQLASELKILLERYNEMNDKVASMKEDDPERESLINKKHDIFNQIGKIRAEMSKED